MLRRTARRLGSTNRYTDGSGRRLDSNELPADVYLETISNRAYPVRGEHWQPVVQGETTPHKGNVIVSGGGVLGMSIAAQFALRGWHTTVIEKRAALAGVSAFSDADYRRGRSTAMESNHEVLRKVGPFTRIEHALVTRRAADALETAGVPLSALRECSVKVSGVLDHPGAYNTWLTRGLVEHHPFAVNMLSTDLFLLKQLLEQHLAALPVRNCRVFHEHAVEAVFPLKQTLSVKPVHELLVPLPIDEYNGGGVPACNPDSHTVGDATSGGEALVKVARTPKRKRMETSLTLSNAKWERKYSASAVSYDLLVCAEGANSHLRNLLDVEGFAADNSFGVKWFVLRSSTLSASHIHRWLHKSPDTSKAHGRVLHSLFGTSSSQSKPVVDPYQFQVKSAAQIPLCIAFPRREPGTFSVMAYFPMEELHRLSDAEFCRTYCPDALNVGCGDTFYSLSTAVQPFPTIYCENLYNSVGLPSAVVVGDAAHACNPFWLQGLAIGLEDGINLLNQVDAYSRHFYDAVKQYSEERGSNGDALRELTDRCLYYQRRKHSNPFIRFQNRYQRFMNVIFPKLYNDMYAGSTNHVYSKSIEAMLNGRGYTSYEYAEKQQSKHRSFLHLGRLYT